MRLNKKTKANIAREAKRIKAIYEAKNHEVDRIVAELREEAKNRPKGLTREQEIAWILNQTDNKDRDNEIKQLLNDD